MVNTTEINDEATLRDFNECLEKCTECDALATLKQAAQRADGELNVVDLQQVVVEVRTAVNVNDNTNLVYVDLNGDRTQMRKIRELWEAANKRGTMCKNQGKPNDYLFVIDLIYQDMAQYKLYCLSFLNPWFMSTEEKGICFALPYENFKFGIEETSCDEMNYEDLEYQERNGRQLAYEDDEDEEYDGGEEYDDGSENFINTDDYTDALQ